MKIALINPNFNDTRAADALQPLVFALLKALTPPEIEVAFYDERVEKVEYSRLRADLAALSVQTFTARRSYTIADTLRARKIPVVLGGIHPTLLPEEASAHADTVVVGDAEPVWPAVIEDARCGRLHPVYRGEVTAPLGGVIPDRSLFQGKRYGALYPLQFGRGCRYSCDFCSVKALYGSSIRQRPIAEVVDEVRGLRRHLLFFVDDNLLADREKTCELLECLIPLRVRWACQISVDAAFDDALLTLMRRAGCVLVFMGFESLNPASLRGMGKTANLRHREHRQTVRRVQSAGIMASGSFVFGYDSDREDAVHAALDMALKCRLVLAHFNPAMPTPATALYNRLAEQGRLIYPRWWLHPQYRYGDTLFSPRNMSPEALKQVCYRAKCRFNTIPNILRRAWEPRTNSRSLFNLGVFLAANFISRSEIRKKQGFALG